MVTYDYSTATCLEGSIANASSSAPQFAVAGLVLEALATRDFDRLDAALDGNAVLCALLPGGYSEWRGAADITAAFERWFGDVDEIEVVDASVDQVGSRLQLRWRVRLRAPRFCDEARLVEQHVYADTTATGRIRSMSLLCSGFCKELFDV